ncbi:MAG: 2-dehydro-3-deoxygalactonokinase [Mesorhizobium sp.]|nr:2-dehydro-3-deoxygalactonokinase [Mesorhizobium sp.]MCO5161106.1 2-dehydro-3-deoxygalactonokinase [Mesorhizobium sp.]
MTSPAVLAAVDWGTSNLRVWLLDAAGEVIAERKSGEGMSSAGTKGFANVLEEHLAAMNAPDGLPAIVCGMAGARQGWVEAGYLDVPARISDFAHAATEAPGARRPVSILPGLAQRGAHPDVMRGEETQIAGAGLGGGTRFVCMPGTHSKWVRVEDGVVTGFTTSMTGELFHLLATQSILRHSLGEGPDAGAPAVPAFRKAVEDVLAHPQRLTSALFSIRAGGLLSNVAAGDAAATLSGLLIGAEIAGAMSASPGMHVVTLVASGFMAKRYAAALAAAGLLVEFVDADAAVRKGLFEAGRRLYLSGAPA